MTTYGPNANGITFTTSNFNSLLNTYTVSISNGSTTLASFTGVPAADIITTSGSTLNIASLLNGSNFFIVPGVTANITIGVSLASANTVYVGGNATLTSAVSALSTMAFDVYGGTLTASSSGLAGLLAGTTVNLTNGGEFTNGGGLASLLNGTTINYGTGGGSIVVNAGGATVDLSSTTINGFTAGSDALEFTNLAQPLGSYSVTNATSGQTITLFASGGATLGTVTVAGTALPIGTVNVGQSGPLTVTESGSTGAFNVTLDASPGSTACFLGETLIATPYGEKRVDELGLGDLVLTDKGDAVPVRWIGRRSVSPRFADPLRVLPVRIRAGALDGHSPSRDLLISPDHALLIGNTLVNAGALVNGETILREPISENFVYYHVEVDEHDLILAEGVSVETFIDNVDRMVFDNWAEHAAIYGDAPGKPEMAYPRVTSARQLPQAIRAALAAQMPNSRAAA